MAAIIQSGKLEQYSFSEEEKLHVYCGLDNCLTHEIMGHIETQLNDADTRQTYEFEMGMLGPAFAMMRRGFKVDLEAVELALHGDGGAKPHYQMFDERWEAENDARDRRLGLYQRRKLMGGMEKVGKKWEITNEDALIQRYAYAIWDKPLNYNSPIQLKALLYDELQIPPVMERKGAVMKPVTNRAALEKIIGTYPRGEPICRVLMIIRDLQKKIDILTKQLTSDGRMATSYNVAGCETGRWSSSESCFKTGTNMQNITPELRSVFVADPGYVMFHADLEQAESRATGYLSEDEKYIEACESGDLHSTVASMVFGIEPDKESTSRRCYRHFTYRDMAKRAGHGTNYALSPISLARHMHIPNSEAFKFHMLYLGGELPLVRAEKLGLLDLPHSRIEGMCLFEGAFLGIKLWHERLRIELESNGVLWTPYNRKRTFWERLDSSTTLREAIANGPQSMIGDLLNIGLWRVWDTLEPEGLQLLAQGHDSITGQIPKEKLDDLLPRVLECMNNPTQVKDKIMVVPVEAKVGYDWHNLVEWTKWQEGERPKTM